MLPFSVPSDGPLGCPEGPGGKRVVPGKFPPPGGGGVFCADTIWKEMAIPIASPSILRNRMLVGKEHPFR